MNKTANTLITLLVGSLAGVTPAELSAFTAALLAANSLQLNTLHGWVVDPAGGRLLGTPSRTFFAAALSAAIIECGVRADACTAGSATNVRHLDRMNALDAIGGSLATNGGR